MITHVKYQSSSTYCSKVINKVKFSEEDRMTNQRGQKQFATDLRSRRHNNNNLKLQGQVHRVKKMVPTERYYHKEISKLYHSLSKVITKVKVFKK